MRDHVVKSGQPVELLYRVAAGKLPDGHWLNDPDEGGGRLLGEGCHFVDFVCWFMQDLPSHVAATVPQSTEQLALAQRFTITLGFQDGSIATILYGSESAGGVGKEFVEAHSGGRSARLDDYRRLELLGPERRRVLRGRNRDKGHAAQFVAFRKSLAGEPPSGPDPLETMAVTFDALAAASSLG